MRLSFIDRLIIKFALAKRLIAGEDVLPWQVANLAEAMRQLNLEHKEIKK